MSISHLLQDFAVTPSEATAEISQVLLEEERLESFEKGYQAGWDDSNKARTQTSDQLSAEVVNAITALVLTHEQASLAVLDGLKPLIHQIVQTVLPRIAQDTLAARLSEIIGDLVATHGAGPLIITVAAGQADTLAGLDLPTPDTELSIVEDPSLAPQDVQLQLGAQHEQEVNLSATIDQIADAIDAYFNSDMTEEQRISA